MDRSTNDLADSLRETHISDAHPTTITTADHMPRRSTTARAPTWSDFKDNFALDGENGNDDEDKINDLPSGTLQRWWPETKQNRPRTTEHAPVRSPDEVGRSPFQPFDLRQHDECPAWLRLCPFELIHQYPHRWVGKANHEEVSMWFDKEVFGRVWDIFYLQDPDGRRDPVIFAPTIQFEQFLNIANSQLQKDLSIPRGNSRDFSITFGDMANELRPRFLGRVNNELAYRALQVPTDAANYDGKKIDETQEFRSKIYYIYKSLEPKSRKKPDGAAKRRKRMGKQMAWGRVTKRVQRYLGLRARSAYSLAEMGTTWDVYSPAPFDPELSARFVCVDVEACERDHHIVTEIGVAILDSDDITGIPPGERGEHWFQLIKAHHLRIKEWSHKVNYKYVRGCPDMFGFGESQWVAQADVAKRVEQIIIGGPGSTDDSPIVMVGHDIGCDLKYLLRVGYNIWRVPQFVDEVDTKLMFQRVQQLPQGRSLESICDQLEIPGRNFHNAGNDAVYTLRAMIAIALRRKVGGPPTVLPGDLDGQDLQDEEEWTEGEVDDGGSPIKSLEPPEATRPAPTPRDPFKNQVW